MQILGQKLLGVVILILLGMLVIIKRRATGSLIEIDRHTQPWVWLTNLFNLFFLLAVNPAAAVLLIAGRLEALDPTHLAIGRPLLVAGIEIFGMILYLLGFGLMAWALAILGSSYQLGGSPPRAADVLVQAGPYRLIRHPMYTAALSIALGLTLLTQSLLFLAVFCVYLGLILNLVPIEETELQRAYPDQYGAYRESAKKLIPFIY